MSIHHVTAIAGDPVKNLSFYARDQILIVSMILRATKGAMIGAFRLSAAYAQ